MSAALQLRKKNHLVLIIEKNDTYGGKLQDFESSGYRFDNGPSLFTEPELVDELFLMFNRNPRDYYQFEEHNESCRYFFDDNSNITLSKNKGNIEKVLENQFPNDKDAFSEYISRAKQDYDSVGSLFLDEEQPKGIQFLKPNYLKHYPYFAKRRFNQSLNTYNEHCFSDKRLQLLFNRFGTYNGSNPYQMSGIYSMISHLEINKGTYFPKGGMRSIVNALYQLCLDVGIEFKFNSFPTVDKIDDTFSIVVNQDKYFAEHLICAIDHLSFYKNVVKDMKSFNHYQKQERSSSGLVFYWGVNIKIKELGLHNIIFGPDYETEFKEIFELKKAPSTPTIYIHNSSILNNEDAPNEGQNLFIMINTHVKTGNTEEYRDQMKKWIIEQINNHFNIDITNHIVCDEFWDCDSIEKITGSYEGAIYGASSNTLTSTFKRHPNRSRKIKGLYFCGGTVHPGGGIPLVLRSSKIVSNLL